MEHIGKQLAAIDQNMRLNTSDPIAQHGFTQLPNFILRNPDLSANAKTVGNLEQYRFSSPWAPAEFQIELG